MWFLIPLVVVVAVIRNDLLLEHRTTLAGYPINIYDGMLVVGLILALMPFRGGKTAVGSERVHPMLWPIIVAYCAALFVGVMVASTGLAETYWIVSTARNLAVLPLSIFIAYRLTLSFAGCKGLVWAHILTGVAVAILISLGFLIKGREVLSFSDVNKLREVKYIGNLGAIAAALLLFTMVADVKIMPRALAIFLAIICFGGHCATLSRSDWMSGMVALGAVFILVPREHRYARLLVTGACVVLLLVGLWMGLLVADRIIGHDLPDEMLDRISSISPWYQSQSRHAAAWEGRFQSGLEEINLWVEHPIFGGGFGIQDVEMSMRNTDFGGFRHNTWTSTLAETGPAGFCAMVMVFAAMFVVGYRMVKDRLDRTTVLVGALGVITAVNMTVQGLCTMSFNTQRPAMMVGLICGIVLRCRAMQQTCKANVGAAPAPPPEARYLPWSVGARARQGVM